MRHLVLAGVEDIGEGRQMLLLQLQGVEVGEQIQESHLLGEKAHHIDLAGGTEEGAVVHSPCQDREVLREDVVPGTIKTLFLVLMSFFALCCYIFVLLSSSCTLCSFP